MPSTGAIIAGTGASLAGIGTVAITNPDRITASDNSYATANLGGSAVSRWCVATNFDFSTIPDDAAILGVTGTAEIKGPAGSVISSASFVVGGAVVGTAKSLSISIPLSDTNCDVGGANDLWGYLITPAVLKVSTTGFAISCTGVAIGTVSIDAMWLTVEYAQPGPMYRRLIQKQKRLRGLIGGTDGRD